MQIDLLIHFFLIEYKKMQNGGNNMIEKTVFSDDEIVAQIKILLQKILNMKIEVVQIFFI